MEITFLAKLTYFFDLMCLIGFFWGWEGYLFFKMKPKQLAIFLFYCFIPFAGIRRGFKTVLLWEGVRVTSLWIGYSMYFKFLEDDGSLHPSEVFPAKLLFIFMVLFMHFGIGGFYAPETNRHSKYDELEKQIKNGTVPPEIQAEWDKRERKERLQRKLREQKWK